MTAEPAELDESGGLRAFQRLDAATTTSGALTDEALPVLTSLGVRRVINLALDSHPDAWAGEGEKLAAAGIGYTHIPVPFDAPSQAHYDAFAAALEAAEGPVHVHCIMNWRVSAFFYRRHREQGMDERAARALLVRQWDPATSENPHADKWASFIAAQG